MTYDRLPPGTQRIEDKTGQKILLAPQPNADPNQPLNWSPFRKSLHMTILCFYALMVFAILCVAVPLWQDFNTELGMSYAVLNDGYATNMAALSVGCIIFVPIALRVGRRPVYLATALIMLAAAIWQARMRTVGDMIGANVISGLAGAVNEAVFQVTVSDLFFVHQRGTMNGIYLAIVIIGNYLGPVAAGYVAVSQHWRWVFWYCTIFMAIVALVMAFFLEETKYTPLVTDGREVVLSTAVDQGADDMLAKVNSTTKSATAATRLGSISVDATEAAQNTERRRLVEIDHSIPLKSYRTRHALWSLDKQVTSAHRPPWMHFIQPFHILVTFPAVMFTALQYGFLIAMLAILAVTQATLYPFPPYNFTPIGVGNMNLPPAIGAILGSLFGGPLNDYFIVQVAKRRGGIYEPETRLWLFLIPGACMPVGLFMYGLTISRGMAWPINAVGAGFIGAAIGGCGDISLTYCQDCYQYILGDALTGVVFVRNIISTGLVFAVTPWIAGMGVYDMFVLLGCLSVAVALTCIPLIVWGRAWRARLAGRYEHFAAKQY
ncbi:hypothetical protein G647_04378 [Cladophialophora carrionii CBS 160.54]|uniref:Major facilitator superfamily (MFS) profile domain-containing protein n=1 Tax=Cladophialophora carrionii CBS 160.54 TaxID=1279043 RepID=V9DFA3_9EURO|nr:uncharacterized protein G647_04378 [Cladophialophora carrionii CBS 160.54]ETI25008.1 hypothetical protein G647_04378 [Cladophialophora carrionii CBS 160.54]